MERMRKVLFISGLPCSGFTLLAGVLLQNSRFYVAMSSLAAFLMGSFYTSYRQNSIKFNRICNLKSVKSCIADVNA